MTTVTIHRISPGWYTFTLSDRPKAAVYTAPLRVNKDRATALAEQLTGLTDWSRATEELGADTELRDAVIALLYPIHRAYLES